MIEKNWFRASFQATSLLLVATLYAGCGADEQNSRKAEIKKPQEVARAVGSCCQCPSVPDLTTTPPSVKLEADCSDNAVSADVCNSDCKTKGYPSGGLAAGACKAAPAPSKANICQ